MLHFRISEASVSPTAQRAGRKWHYFYLAMPALRYFPTIPVRHCLKTRDNCRFLPRLMSPEIDALDDDFLFSNAVGHLLMRSRQSLHTLHLDIALRQPIPTEDKRERLAQTLACLSSFPVLRILLLHSSLFLNSGASESAESGRALGRLLPSSIISLQVVAPDDLQTGELLHLETALVHLARDVSQGRFPRLKSVSCHIKHRLDASGFGVLFTGVGVEFGYDGWHFHDGVRGQPLYSWDKAIAKGIEGASDSEEDPL